MILVLSVSTLGTTWYAICIIIYNVIKHINVVQYNTTAIQFEDSSYSHIKNVTVIVGTVWCVSARGLSFSSDLVPWNTQNKHSVIITWLFA